MVANASNMVAISSFVTKNSGLPCSCHNHNFISLHWGFKQTLCSSRKPYWKIFPSETLNIRKEVNPSFCFAVFILSRRKTSKWLTVFEMAQTLDHWLRHVCLCIVLLTCKEPSYRTFIRVSGDQTFAFGDYFLPIIIYWPLS